MRVGSLSPRKLFISDLGIGASYSPASHKFLPTPERSSGQRRNSVLSFVWPDRLFLSWQQLLLPSSSRLSSGPGNCEARSCVAVPLPGFGSLCAGTHSLAPQEHQRLERFINIQKLPPHSTVQCWPFLPRRVMGSWQGKALKNGLCPCFHPGACGFHRAPSWPKHSLLGRDGVPASVLISVDQCCGSLHYLHLCKRCVRVTANRFCRDGATEEGSPQAPSGVRVAATTD